MKSWNRVLLETVLAVHDRQIAEHGGAPGVRDIALVESALARPENLAAYGDPDAAELAASYGRGLVADPGFIDGNKRTAYVTARLCLELNGFVLSAPLVERVVVFTGAGAGTISEREFVEWFRKRVQPKA